MAKQTSRDDLESVATVYPDSGALGFLKQAVLPTVQPNANQARTQVAAEDDQPKSTKPAEDLSGKDSKPASKEDFQTWLLISMMAANDKTDEDGNISASHISGFIKSLETLGVPTQPLKDIIEEVSGKPYAEFEASASSGGYVSADAIVNHPRSGGRFSRDRGPLNTTGFDSARALRIAGSDDAGLYQCARGTANVLLGLGQNVQRDHATYWDDHLSKNRNWVRLKVDPAHAPEGAVLVFNNNLQAGRGACNNGKGAEFGHVEIVAENAAGKKVFISDTARQNWGGSVPENYAGAFLYVGPNAPAGNLQLAQQINGGSTRFAQSGPLAPSPV